MERFKENHLRPCRRWTDILPIALIAAFFLVLAGQLLGSLLLELLQFEKWFEPFIGEDGAYFLWMYASNIGCWVFILILLWLIKPDRPMLKAVFFDKRGNSFRWILIGLLVGFGMNGFCILCSVLFGDISLAPGNFNLPILLCFLLAVAVQSGAEELLTRVYLYQKLRRRYRHPAVAIVGNSVFFALLHLMNPDVSLIAIIQIIGTGLLFSLFVYYYGSFWAAAAIHTAWNYTQSILFGLPNSGIVSAFSLFRLEAASARNGFFYNVGFGVEGSIGATLVIYAVCAVVAWTGSRKKYREDLWKETEEMLTETPAAAQ